MVDKHEQPLPANEIDQERLAAITRLDKGKHPAADYGMCVMEAVAYVRHQEHTDYPACVHPNIGMVARKINDSITHSRMRTELLLPFIPRLVGTHEAPMDALIKVAVDYAALVNPRSVNTRRAESLTLISSYRAFDYALTSVIAAARRHKDWSIGLGLLEVMISTAKPQAVTP